MYAGDNLIQEGSEYTQFAKRDLLEKVKLLEQENAKHLRNINFIIHTWKELKAKTQELQGLYIQEVDKNKKLTTESKELTSKLQRTTIFLDLTEKARNNIETLCRKFKSDMESLAKEKVEAVVVGVLDESSESQSRMTSSGEDENSDTLISFTSGLKHLAPTNLVLNARVASLTRSCEDFQREVEKRDATVNHMKKSIVRLKSKVQEEALFRSVLEKRIQVMQESLALNVAEIEELKAKEQWNLQAHNECRLKVEELEGTLVSVEESAAAAAMQRELLAMLVEDRETKMLQLAQQLESVTKERDRLVASLQEVKREDPVLLQQLRYEISTLNGQRNHLESKAQAIGKELKQRLQETRKVLTSMSKMQRRLEEVTNERSAFKTALDSLLNGDTGLRFTSTSASSLFGIKRSIL